jgi:predicted Zn-dependent protease
MNNHHDNYPTTPNPYRRSARQRWMARALGTLAWVRFQIVRPFRLLAGTLGRMAGTAAIILETRLGRWARWWAVRWYRLGAVLRLDLLRRRVDTWQDSASRSVDELTMAVRQRTSQASWMRRLRERLQTVGGRVRDAWMRLLSRAEQSWFTRVLTAPLRWLTYGLLLLADFFVGWLWTRHYRRLLYGIPAILLVMPLAFCAVRLPFYSPQAKARHYRRAANEALATADYPTATLYFRKLAQLGDAHHQVLMQSALLAEQQGDLVEAYRQMQQLAPLDQAGLAEAHLWIAQEISIGAIEMGNPQASALIETHLRHAAAGGLEDPSLRIWLARIYWLTNRRQQCQEILDQMQLNELPWLARVGAADMLAQLGQLQRARALAISASEHYRQQSDQGTELTADEYSGWAAAAELAGNPGEAFDALLQAVAAYPQDTRLRRVAAQTGLSYFDRYRGDTPVAWQRRMRVLQQLRTLMADQEPVLRRAAELTLVPSVSAAATQILQDYQQTAPLPASVEKTLGDTAVVHGDSARARDHYRVALTLDPQLDGALNNLAYLLASEEPRDLEQALQLAQRAVQLRPNDPHFLETRGQILVQLKRWQEAVDDLTRSLNGMPYKREIHASLATAYRALGQTEAAESHASQAAR